MILLNDFSRHWAEIRDDALPAFTRVGESGWYILGSEVAAFEHALATCWNVEHCVGVASGLDAIEIGLRALGCGPGDRVLTTPVSAFATTLAIVKLGAIPVFVDTTDHGLIDLEACERLLAQRPDIRFFVPVHLFGHTLDTERIRRFNVRSVHDCAQAVGARFVGEIGATSFYPTKNLGTLGDGGALVTNSGDLAERARALRDYGQTAKYRHDYVGCNSRLDEIHAALLARVFLPRLERWNDRRRQIAHAYLAAIRNPHVRPLDLNPSCWHLFPVLVAPARKQAFRDFLQAAGIQTGEHYPVAIPDQPAMKNVSHELVSDLPRARRFCASEVSLPIHPHLRDDEVQRVIEACELWPA
jgi:dTDP-3-amino-3,4,6-trideoxy-alpha-D-glucose transaminase